MVHCPTVVETAKVKVKRLHLAGTYLLNHYMAEGRRPKKNRWLTSSFIKDAFIFIYMCMSITCVRMPTKAKKIPDPLGLELHVVVTHPVWFLGTKLHFSERTEHAFNFWVIFLAFSTFWVLGWQCIVPCIGFEVLGSKPRVSCVLGWTFINWAKFKNLFVHEMLIFRFDGVPHWKYHHEKKRR